VRAGAGLLGNFAAALAVMRNQADVIRGKSRVFERVYGVARVIHVMKNAHYCRASGRRHCSTSYW